MKKYIIKYLAIICLIFIFFYASYSQDAKNVIFDEINNISDTAKKIEKLLEYAEKFIKINDSISIDLLNLSQNLSEKSNNSKAIVSNYEIFSEIFKKRGNKHNEKQYLLNSIFEQNKIFHKDKNDTLNSYGLIYNYLKLALFFEEDEEFSIALAQYDNAITIANKIANKSLEIKILVEKSKCNIKKNDYEAAISNLEKSLKISEENDVPNEIFEIFHLLGNANYLSGNIKIALDFFFMALEEAEKKENKNYIAQCYNNISEIYAELNFLDKALEYNSQSINILSHLQDTLSYTVSLVRQAEIFYKLADYEQSLNYYFKTVEFLKNEGEFDWLATAYNGIAQVNDQLENYSEAYKYYLISLSIRNKEGKQKKIANSYISLGQHYFKTKNYEDAEIYLLKGYLLAKENKENFEVLNAAKSLSELYEQKNEYDKAYEYQQTYKSLSDSFVNQEIANTLAKLELEYEFEKEKKLQEQELDSLKKIKNLTLGIIIFLFLFVLYFLYSNKTIRKKNKALAEKTLEIESQNEIIRQKSEEFEKLAIVASKSENGVIIMDKYANIEWINSGGEKIYSSDERLKSIKVGQNLRNISSQVNISELIDFCITNKKSINYDFYNEDEDFPLWLQTTLTPIVENDEVIKLIAVDTDVTKIKFAEKQIINQKQELQEKSELLSLYVSQLNAQKIAMMENNEELQQQREELLTQTELLELTNKKLEKLSIVASKTDNSVFITEPDGTISWVNDAFIFHTGYDLDDFKKRFGSNIKEASSYLEIDEVFNKCINTKKTVVYSSKMMTKSGDEKWFQTTLTPIIDDNNNIIQIVAIDTDITKIKIAEEKIAEQNQEIKDSITYARRIQKALLPMEIYVDAVIDDYFILNLPRDIVSGDFYWFGYRDEKIIAAVADCTGHGIPGAFMSMLGIMSLNNIVYRQKDLKADEILNTLKETIINLLHQRGKEGEARDGMDIVLTIIDLKNKKIQYAGANNPLYIVKNKLDTDNLPQFIKLAPDKMPIGYFLGKQSPFSEQIFEFEKGDTIYLSSDGYIDQFGGSEGRKFLSKNFKKLLRQIKNSPMQKQRDTLYETFFSWKGEQEQVDDIMIVGIHFTK